MKNNPYKLYINGALLLIGGIVAYRLVKGLNISKQAITGLITDIKTDAQAKQLTDALSTNGINAVDGKKVVQIAEEIYSALHKDSLFGWGEDEEKAVNAFNKLQSVGEAKAAAGIYLTNYSKNLFEDLKKYIHGNDWNRLKSFLLNAIK